MTKIKVKGTDVELPAAEGPYNLKVYPPQSLRKVMRHFRQRLKEQGKVAFNKSGGAYDHGDLGSAFT